jgi:hypothetical protein
MTDRRLLCHTLMSVVEKKKRSASRVPLQQMEAEQAVRRLAGLGPFPKRTAKRPALSSPNQLGAPLATADFNSPQSPNAKSLFLVLEFGERMYRGRVLGLA